jgi:hypothetical protein
MIIKVDKVEILKDFETSLSLSSLFFFRQFGSSAQSGPFEVINSLDVHIVLSEQIIHDKAGYFLDTRDLDGIYTVKPGEKCLLIGHKVRIVILKDSLFKEQAPFTFLESL